MNKHELHGLWLGLLGVLLFSITLPVTRLAVGTPEAPFLTGFFIAFGRAGVAGLLSAVYLVSVKATPPTAKQCQSLAMVSLGVVFGFPLLTSLAMRYVPAAHASVITGYNTRRKEFLVTECWGENYRNQRISYEELLATTKPKIIQVVSP